jgi:hypothetical protein
VSIKLPHYLVLALDILGFEWPDIDEDQVREAATHLRAYARDARESIAVTHRTLTVDIAEVYSSGAYETLVRSWATQTRGHMEALCECAEALATAFDAAAVGVEVMKSAVIVQLGIALDEFVAAQALAIETLGASEAALGGLLAIQNRILSGIMARFEAEVVDVLVTQAIQPVRAKMHAALNKLLYPEVRDVVLAPHGMKADTDAIRRHAATIGDQARGALIRGRELQARLGALTYTSS